MLEARERITRFALHQSVRFTSKVDVHAESGVWVFY
jgi:hypothetical protein